METVNILKIRRHHNNKGYRQIKNGSCEKQVKAIAKRLNIPYGGPMERSEHESQVILFDYIRLYSAQYPDLRKVYAIPNGEKRHMSVARRLKKEGIIPGVLDIHCPCPRNGYSGLWIEMKHGRNKMTDNQGRWQKLMEEEGHKVVTCYCAESAKRVLFEYLGVKG